MAGNKKQSRQCDRQFPIPLGVTIKEDRIMFAVAVPNAKECILKLYLNNKQTLIEEIKLTKDYQFGSVFSIELPKKELKANCYLYEALGKEFIDPYVNRVIGRDEFGKAFDHETELLGTWSEDTFDWGEDESPRLEYTDMIMYKLHVRGFTMHPASGVKHKGTYRGIIEKIPYLKELGVNALFLMPCVEFNESLHHEDPLYRIPRYTKQYAAKGTFQPLRKEQDEDRKINYWGYTTNSYYFAPKASYASNPSQCIHEFKTMVKALHHNGIELLLDMNFPQDMNPYMMAECLRYWKSVYHVDGFHVNASASAQQLIAQDPFLTQTKLLASNYNIDSVYPKEVEPLYKNLAEYNDGFLTDVRRFLKGDEEQVYKFTDRFRRNQTKTANINFITDHNGFTLADLYMYDVKHNEGNGENNHDGTDYNYSWNCGVEGPIKKRKIIDLRTKMTKNALAALFLSQGTPMLLAGDEFGNSQQGNNNAYCQDNEIGWVDWKKKRSNKELIDYIKNLIVLRKAHPVLHNKNVLKGLDYISCGCPDISFHGIKPWVPDYSNYSRTIGIWLNGNYAMLDRKTKDQSCYLIFNMHWEAHIFDLPHLDSTQEWKVILQTGQEELQINHAASKRQIELSPRSMAVLMSTTRS